jgi:hypothetical protein
MSSKKAITGAMAHIKLSSCRRLYKQLHNKNCVSSCSTWRAPVISSELASSAQYTLLLSFEKNSSIVNFDCFLK